MAASVFPKPTSLRMPQYMGEVGCVLHGFGGVRRSGSMALETACLAAGRLDAFRERDMGAWDVAADVVVLRKAGAVVHARDGNALLNSRSLMAGTPAWMADFAASLRP